MTATILLQQAQGGGMSGLLMIVAMIVIFYFFMIRPQNKKQKELKRQREAMKVNDKVVTQGGIHGRIAEIKDDVLMVSIAPNVNIKIDRSMVYPLIETPAAGEKK